MLLKLTIVIGVLLMSHEGEHSPYLSDEGTVEKIYGYLKVGEVDSVVAHFKSLGEDKVVVQTWVNVQCDINNVKHDPELSAVVGQKGVEYCLEKGYKRAAAMMLHNISAFFMPDFDEGLEEEAKSLALDAARRQVTLRREVDDPGPLMWALWDLGLAELAAGHSEEAINSLEEGEAMAKAQNDASAAAWCRMFIGKAKVKYLPDKKEEGLQKMREAAKVIMDGEEWERESAVQILKSVGITL